MAAAGEDCAIFTDILSKIEGHKYCNAIKDHIDDMNISSDEIKNQELSERFLHWARQEKNLKVISADIPARILPNDYEGRVHDVKVFVTRGPDDSVYDNNQLIRDRVARGNSFLELTNKAPCTFCVLQAMKKFTGGLGDDDDRESGDDMIWQRYFTKPIEDTKVIIATDKANGEAAHLSCIKLDNEYIMCGGSKNVHLMFRNESDIDRYVEPRYRIATEVCHTVMDFLKQMTEGDKQRLMEFLVASRYTAVFEILHPEHQHVVNLSYLKKPQLKFISWTKCELEASVKLAHLNIVPPHVGIEIAKCLGLDPVSYEEVTMNDLAVYIKQIRHGCNSEGKVLYFLDNEDQVIGLLKKKTTWYIICRAIREKTKNAVLQSKKYPNNFSLSKTLNKVDKRINEIQKWLGLDRETTEAWKELGRNAIDWALKQVDDGKLSVDEIQNQFPGYWNQFLSDTGSTDKIGSQDTNTSTDSTSGACGTGT
ncbi:hypothetical protein ACF0H5_006997 [Mactra antiquata]